MARPRTPSAVLELRGSFKTHPERRRERENEPQVNDPVGQPRAHLSDLAKEVWQELSSVGYWLTAADRAQLEIACELMAIFRATGVDPKLITPTINSLNKLGFSPGERAKVCT